MFDLCLSSLSLTLALLSGKEMGALDYLYNFCTVPSTKTKRKAVQTVEIKVKMDCDGCERVVRNAVAKMKGFITGAQVDADCNCSDIQPQQSQQPKCPGRNKCCGVKSVEINRKQGRVTVSGYVDANKVLKRVRRTGKKRAEFWPYVPQHVVSYPHASGVYDKRAPAGYVRNVQTFPASNETEEKFMSFFSEDNVNACSIM